MKSLVCALALFAGCYSPSITNGQFTCQGGSDCPAGFSCRCGGLCVSSSLKSCPSDLGVGPTSDMKSVHDLGPSHADMTKSAPCTNGGARSPGDPGLTQVAACPAAWTRPGLLDTTTPCNRQPSANGKGAGGAACTALDNCGAGWHLCTGETELMSDGFTQSQCSGLSSGLWVTLQKSRPPAMDAGTMPSPPACGTTPGEDHFVFGCGSLGATMGTGCAILNHTLATMPNSGTDQCSQSTGGDFLCTGVSPGKFEINVVTKAKLDGGGVLCCADP